MKVLLLIAYLIVCAVIILAVPPIVAEFPDYANFSDDGRGSGGVGVPDPRRHCRLFHLPG